jgi:cysteine desulfurase family protein (TIGR01976 family)
MSTPSDATGYDVAAVRARFSALRKGIAFFDGPGGTQTPEPVITAIADTLGAPLSNRGTETAGARNAETVVTEARAAMAALLGGDPRGIVFGRSATQLTYDFARTVGKTWSPGDEVVVTKLDHDANIRPWVQAATAAGATVRWAEFDPVSGELTVEHLRAVLSDRTRLVAVTGASNLIGSKPPVAELAALAHARGALLYVDGVHRTAHSKVDIAELGADFYVCSPYKFCGPHLGVLAASPALLETLRPDKLLPSTDSVPERFEFGTLPYELLAGTTAAVRFLAGLGAGGSGGSGGAPSTVELHAAFDAIHEHESALLARILDGIAALPWLTVRSRAVDRTPTLLLTIDGIDTAEAAAFLATKDIAAPAGSFYALEASRHLGLGDTGGLRIGLAPYTNEEDIDRLLQALHDFSR